MIKAETRNTKAAFLLNPAKRTDSDYKLIQDYFTSKFSLFKGLSMDFFKHLNYNIRAWVCEELYNQNG